MPSPWVIMDETTWKLWNNEDSLRRRPIVVNRLSKTDTTENLMNQGAAEWLQSWPRRQPLTDSPLQLGRVWTQTLTMYIVRVACSQASLASSGSAHYSNNRLPWQHLFVGGGRTRKTHYFNSRVQKGPTTECAAAIRTCEQQLGFLCKVQAVRLRSVWQ